MRTGYCVMTLGFCGVTFWWRCAMRWGDLWCCRERKGGHSYLESLTVWEWTCIDEWEYADTVDSHAALVCLIESICQERFKELIIRTGLARKSSDPRAVLPWDSRVVPLWLSFLVDLQSCHVAEKTWEYLPWTYCPSILSPRLQKISRKGQKISGVHTGAVVQRVGSHSFATSPGRRLALWLRSWRDWPHHWSGAAYPQLVWKTGHFMISCHFQKLWTIHPPFIHHFSTIRWWSARWPQARRWTTWSAARSQDLWRWPGIPWDPGTQLDGQWKDLPAEITGKIITLFQW